VEVAGTEVAISPGTKVVKAEVTLAEAHLVVALEDTMKVVKAEAHLAEALVDATKVAKAVATRTPEMKVAKAAVTHMIMITIIEAITAEVTGTAAVKEVTARTVVEVVELLRTTPEMEVEVVAIKAEVAALTVVVADLAAKAHLVAAVAVTEAPRTIPEMEVEVVAHLPAEAGMVLASNQEKALEATTTMEDDDLAVTEMAVTGVITKEATATATTTMAVNHPAATITTTELLNS
jgi:hypothetical protein